MLQQIGQKPGVIHYAGLIASSRACSLWKRPLRRAFRQIRTFSGDSPRILQYQIQDTAMLQLFHLIRRVGRPLFLLFFPAPP